MKLVMMYNKPYVKDIEEVSRLLGMTYSEFDYGGESLDGIFTGLSMDVAEDVFVLSADSRMLKFVHRIVDIEDVYVFDGVGKLYVLQETTTRLLRVGHHLPNLFEAGEFRV